MFSPIGQSRFAAVHPAILLIHQEHVPVQAGFLRRGSPDVLGQGVTLFEVRPGNVDHQPVVPLAKLWRRSARCVRIGHTEGVEGFRLHRPLNHRDVLDLLGHQDIAKVHFLFAGVGHLQERFRRDRNYIRNDFVIFEITNQLRRHADGFEHSVGTCRCWRTKCD